ncbi:sigma 54-interacting transcriptional regulator [Edaphobacter modestus]|uniref:Regulatory Fis family protein n=1 Tax=Edaphobacter modestus TaxID=388466 RepID=A0A4Q7YR54_9BACT|nr:sigma 54-interacting transcriptional regulator [Edaphobacter modestus]RZU39950.1 regulatory Fis family protein [Edaphobacter modestus]
MSKIHGCQLGDFFIGNSPEIYRICDQLQKASLTNIPVLITGESGTGKGLAAQLLHDMSTRCANKFLKLNCSAISNQFFELELFSKAEQVDRGTLFLDEIGELDLALQSKLLHMLRDFRFMGLSGENERPIDVLLICATNRDLEAEIANGAFRADLFHRINVLRMQMPALRDCVTDVPILMSHFVKLYSEKFGKDPVPPSPSFMKVLESYHWPGNTRELENMAKRYVVLGGEDHVLSVMKLPPQQLARSEAIDLTTPLRVQTKRAIRNLESKIILSVLEAHNWNRRKTARSLDISYRTLLYKIKEGGLPRSSKTSLT